MAVGDKIEARGKSSAGESGEAQELVGGNVAEPEWRRLLNRLIQAQGLLVTRMAA